MAETATIVDIVVSGGEGGDAWDVVAQYTYDGFKRNGHDLITLEFETTPSGFKKVDTSHTPPLNGGIGADEANNIPNADTSGTFTISFNGTVLASQDFTLA